MYIVLQGIYQIVSGFQGYDLKVGCNYYYFQVSFQLKPSVAEVDGKVRLPLAQSQFSSANIRKTIIEEEDSEEEGEEEDDSDEFEIIYVSGSDEESD